MKRKIRWIVNDEAESSIHKTLKSAVAEFNRLWKMNYKHQDTLEILRHDQITDEYAPYHRGELLYCC